MGILSWIAVGLFAGLLGRWIVKDDRRGCLYTLAVGVLGGVAYWGYQHDWTLPKFSAMKGEAPKGKEDWCAEHGVPESVCVECDTDLMNTHLQETLGAAPTVVNAALYPKLMWNGRFQALSGSPFDRSQPFSFPPPEGTTRFADPAIRHFGPEGAPMRRGSPHGHQNRPWKRSGSLSAARGWWLSRCWRRTCRRGGGPTARL